jgi:hypothetical protein
VPPHSMTNGRIATAGALRQRAHRDSGRIETAPADFGRQPRAIDNSRNNRTVSRVLEFGSPQDKGVASLLPHLIGVVHCGSSIFLEHLPIVIWTDQTAKAAAIRLKNVANRGRVEKHGAGQ